MRTFLFALVLAVSTSSVAFGQITGSHIGIRVDSERTRIVAGPIAEFGTFEILPDIVLSSTDDNDVYVAGGLARGMLARWALSGELSRGRRTTWETGATYPLITPSLRLGALVLHEGGTTVTPQLQLGDAFAGVRLHYKGDGIVGIRLGGF